MIVGVEGPQQRNADADWDSWPVTAYLAENYRELHPCDASILEHHSAFYRQFPVGSVGRSLEFGAGPNLYPLMLASAASCQIDAVDPSAANVDYLRRQVRDGAEDSWQPFYRRCRELNPELPGTLEQALSRVRVSRGSGMTLAAGDYDLASMTFVAEGISEDIGEFATFCRAFVSAVRPRGYLIAAFMENMSRYGFGDGSDWPGCPIDSNDLRAVFGPLTDSLTISRIAPDRTLPDYGYTGMLLLTARRAAS